VIVGTDYNLDPIDIMGDSGAAPLWLRIGALAAVALGIWYVARK
jgi:hypothetical protein